MPRFWQPGGKYKYKFTPGENTNSHPGEIQIQINRQVLIFIRSLLADPTYYIILYIIGIKFSDIFLNSFVFLPEIFRISSYLTLTNMMMMVIKMMQEGI